MCPGLETYYNPTFVVNTDSLRHTKGHKFSEGASGAFMCFSSDSRYIVKSLDEQDMASLYELLQDYEVYIR